MACMSAVELTEQLLAKAAGWEVIKRARQMLAADRVLSSNWTPPILKGVVQAESTSYRAGLVIKNSIDIENICSCREARQSGIICVHSVAVGLHCLRPAAPLPKPSLGALADPPERTPAASHRRLPRAEPGQPGWSIAIALIFPPNLAEALQRGKITVLFEAITPRARLPLNALPSHSPVQLSPEDARLLDAAETLTGGDPPGGVQLSAAQLATLLPALPDHPRLSLGRQRPLRVNPQPWRPRLNAQLLDDGRIRLRASPTARPPVLVPGEQLWVFEADAFSPVVLPPALAPVLQGDLLIARAHVPVLLSRDWPALAAACELEAGFAPTDFTLEPQPPRFLLALAGGLAQLGGTLHARYDRTVVTPGITTAETLWMPDPKDTRRYHMRDLGAEQAALERLRRAGFTGPNSQGQIALVGEQRVVTFFAREFPRLQREWEVTLEERLERSTEKNFQRLEPTVRITPSGERWFDLEWSVATPDGQRFSAADIQRLLLSGQSHARLRNGKIALLDTDALQEFQEVLRDCAPDQHAQGFRLAQHQAAFVAATLEQHQGWQVAAPSDWQQRVRSLTGPARLCPPPLGALESVLRPYQKQGVAWLAFLRQHRFGGILADDMGLGKTLQVLAFLQSLASASPPGPPRPALVVCPTSLVFNWMHEAATFTPRLRALALDGPRRQSLFARIPEHDLVVTSYALLRRDADLYRSVEFDTVVLDEAQHIKNRETQNAQAVKAMRAQQRLVLTGTPMENSVLDLWSIFDFLMPGYLGTAQDFRERYEQPIVKAKDSAVQSRLARRLQPFVLRRLKSQVAQDLPPRLEQISFCDLTDDQAAVYQELLAASRAQVTEAVGQQGLAKTRLLVLQALLRLRQACCDLRLLKLDGIPPAAASGKLDLFAELLDEILDGGHRALVFSQFTQMLALIRERLEAEQVPYCYLDGSTSNRAAVVQQFQSTSTIPLFLISLKAGGVGLNLTGADTVIHFDPWWNPAVEDQATDRAHRLGQTRVVTSYKLIARGTVEEKILHLQHRKRDLIKSVLGDESTFTDSLSWEDIQELLSP